MKDNKHPHYDLIVEWAKDTSKKWQHLYGDSWHDCGEAGPVWNPNIKYRIKPREFIKGHWYPCIKSDSTQVLMWTGLGFSSTSTFELSHLYKGNYFDDIGESLGEIKFNE